MICQENSQCIFVCAVKCRYIVSETLKERVEQAGSKDFTMKFYYLHIQAGEVNYDLEKDGTYRVNVLPKDSIFQSDGFWALPAIKPIIDDMSNKITYKKVTNIIISENIAASHLELPKHLLKLDFRGIPMKDDFGVYKNIHLVVSEIGLLKLMKLGVQQAEADLISCSIESYFGKNRNLFWMPEPFRKKFIEKFVKR